MVLQTAIQSREGEAPAEPPSRCVYLLRRLSRASGLSRLKSGVPLYAVKDVSLRTRCAGRECATACPLRARSALRCGLLKIAVWDTEDTASERTPMQWHDGPTVFQEHLMA